MGDQERQRRPRSRADPDPTPEEALEPGELQRQIEFLEEEAALLRRRLQDSPRQVRVLEERLLETKGQLAQALSQNERLAATLREARDQTIALQEEVERLTTPPLDFGVLLEMDKDGEWADIRVGDRKLRVGVSQDVDFISALPGDEVLLSEQMNVVNIKAMEPRQANPGQQQNQQHPLASHLPGSERAPNRDLGPRAGSFGRFLNSLELARRGEASPTAARTPPPWSAASRGSGSFATFLNSLNELGDAT
jgi:Proteasomal ATPase OB N-terminal domain